MERGKGAPVRGDILGGRGIALPEPADMVESQLL